MGSIFIEKNEPKAPPEGSIWFQQSENNSWALNQYQHGIWVNIISNNDSNLHTTAFNSDTVYQDASPKMSRIPVKMDWLYLGILVPLIILPLLLSMLE